MTLRFIAGSLELENFIDQFKKEDSLKNYQLSIIDAVATAPAFCFHSPQQV